MKKNQKLDLYKKHAADYLAPRKPVIVTITPAQYRAIAGKGEPGGEAFQSRLGVLYDVALTAKMARKFAGSDCGVCKLEGLWSGTKNKLDFFPSRAMPGIGS